MTGDPDSRSAQKKTNFNMLVVACISAGLIAASKIVSDYLGIADSGFGVRARDYHVFVWGGGVFATTFIPWLFVLLHLRKIRRRRGESFLADTEDLLWVAGMLWNVLAWLGLVMGFIVLMPNGNGMDVFKVGLVAPMVLALPIAIHSAERIMRSGGNFWHAAAMGLCFWLAAAIPTIGALNHDLSISETAWYYSHALSYLLAFIGAYLLNQAPILTAGH